MFGNGGNVLGGGFHAGSVTSRSDQGSSAAMPWSGNVREKTGGFAGSTGSGTGTGAGGAGPARGGSSSSSSKKSASSDCGTGTVGPDGDGGVISGVTGTWALGSPEGSTNPGM